MADKAYAAVGGAWVFGTYYRDGESVPVTDAQAGPFLTAGTLVEVKAGRKSGGPKPVASEATGASADDGD